jgi:hypothetical protein
MVFVKIFLVVFMNKRIESICNNQFFLYCFAVLALFVFLTGCAQPEMQQPLQSGKQDGLPANIMGAQLKGGLSVVYFNDKFRHIDEMPKTEMGIAKYGLPGSPILKLDHKFGRGNVFESGRSQEVGVLMNGFLHLDKPGKYIFQAMSNDGFQLFIDGNLIVSDPGVHGDRLSEPGQFEVVKGGMFPVEIKYFQRKGTATLQLYWQPPGTAFFAIVSGGAYSHIK